MAELNDKLITYGNLSTFYDKLQEQGLGGNAIEDASVLPDAGENKSKLIRLESDDNVYVSELKSKTLTTTNRLPDEQQIDKAYIYFNGWVFNYKGTYKISCSDGDIDGYGWTYYSSDDEMWYFIVTYDDAENIKDTTLGMWIETYDSCDVENKTISIQNITISGLESSYLHPLNEGVITVENNAAIIPATYNAPESAQIGNATISDDDFSITCIYTGTEESIEVEGNNITVYKWYNVAEDFIIYSNKKASEIYYGGNSNDGYMRDFKIYSDYEGNWESSNPKSIYIPHLNAPDSEQVGNATIIDGYWGLNSLYSGVESTIQVDGTDVSVYNWTNINEDTIYSTKPAYQIYNTDRDSIDVHFYTEDEGNIVELTFESGNMTSISTVKYQRTETTEEWGWQPLTDNATNDDIDAMFGTPSGDKFYLLKASDEYGTMQNEAFVHTAGDTVNYNGQTCYRWYKQENDEGTLSSDSYWDDEGMYMLTNTLNIHLPFNKYSDEFVAIISNDSPTSYLASFDEDNFIEMIVE
jgi:hypothetical protein